MANRAKTTGGTVANYLTMVLENSDVLQKDVAEAAGYDNVNVISLMKSGKLKVPIEKAPLIAKALGVDPTSLVRRCLQEYYPALYQTIMDHFGEAVSPSERRILKVFRDATKDKSPEPISKDKERELSKAFQAILDS